MTSERRRLGDHSAKPCRTTRWLGWLGEIGEEEDDEEEEEEDEEVAREGIQLGW